MNKDEQEIRDLVSTWMSASKAGDMDTVLSLMADDAVFLTPGRPAMRKADFAAAARAQAGPNAPNLRGLGGGPSIKRTGPTLTILKKNNGRWVLARDANMLVRVSE